MRFLKGESEEAERCPILQTSHHTTSDVADNASKAE